jgi:hypothetical protein
MPERKLFFRTGVGLLNMSQSAQSPFTRFGPEFREKKGPGNRGHRQGLACGLVSPAAAEVVLLQRLVASLEAEIRRFVVAIGDGGTRHQQTVDGGHKAAEKAGRRCEVQRGGVGHFVPLFRSSGLLGCFPEPNLGIPDASNNLFVCIAAYYLSQCNITGSGGAFGGRGARQGRRKPAAFADLIAA